MADKLYVVVRDDLPPGPQAVQACHAAIQFLSDHVELSRRWFIESNHLAILAIQDEPTLEKLIEKAEIRDIAHSIFREPDLGDRITAVAFEPGDRGRRICSGLPLALNKATVGK